MNTKPATPLPFESDADRVQRLLREHQQLVEALRDAIADIQDELNAAGPAEVEQHPMLRAKDRRNERRRALLRSLGEET